MVTKGKAIANAFKNVSAESAYRGRWIRDSDYAAIIRLEYGLQSKQCVQTRKRIDVLYNTLVIHAEEDLLMTAQ
jgi:hypothetical protein